MYKRQIQKVRSIERDIPEWAMSDAGVQRILFIAFPKLKDNPRQRAGAGVWVRVINLYYRMQLPRQVVAKELDITKEDLNHIIQHISFAQQGLDRNGKPRKRTL